MLVLLSVRIDRCLPVWEGAVHSVDCACLRERLSFYVCVFYPFGFEGMMWDSIVLVPDHCLSFYINKYVHSWCFLLKIHLVYHCDVMSFIYQ